jgi:hypothetical protein
LKKLLILLIVSFFSAQSFAGSCPDGSEPVKSISADGSYFVYNCGGGIEQSSSSSADSSSHNSTNTNSNIKALAGIDIENDPNLDFFKPPNYKLFWMADFWRMQDFNKDGNIDLLRVGSMHPENIANQGEYLETYNTCGEEECKGVKPLPILLLGDANHKFSRASKLIIDNRENNGMSGARQILVADYNNDNTLDFYIADGGAGGGGHLPGYRDSYFLSQPNGTWVESSETHLSHPNLKTYDHGAATGDIDKDGDMDVVITNGTKGFWCLINDGKGYLKKNSCVGFMAWNIELADLDGDGYLDILLGANETEMEKNFTGIVWNEGKGNFPPHNNTPLPHHIEKWGNIAGVSAADLDNDGDIDIVISRTGFMFVGTALQIIENLGNRKFKDHGILPLIEAPDNYIVRAEANDWNDFIERILFRDFDKDGDIDMYLVSNSFKTNSTVLLNQGDFNFSIIKQADLDELAGKPKIVLDKVKKKFKYSASKSQLKLLENQNNVEVCNAISKEFYTGDYFSRTKKNTYFFVSLDSNGKDCHYEWATNENNALRRCKQNTKADGKCTIYALGDNIVWGNAQLYKELTGRD